MCEAVTREEIEFPERDRRERDKKSEREAKIERDNERHIKREVEQ